MVLWFGVYVLRVNFLWFWDLGFRILLGLGFMVFGDLGFRV